MSEENTAGDELVPSEHDPAEVDDAKSGPEDRDTLGPFDASEVPAMRPYVDLGGIKIAPREGLQLRLEVDERAKRVVAVTLDFANSTLQLQAFSAPKSSGLWHQVRGDMKKQLEAQGVNAEEVVGPLGPELAAVVQVPVEQGGGTRPMRFVAVDGPRWLLRGTISGAAATDDAVREQIIELFRDSVVVRGDQPMPPSELLPLKVPAGAQSAPTGDPLQA